MVLGWRDRVAEAHRSRRVPHRARRPPARAPPRPPAPSPDPSDLARALLVDAFDAGAYAPPRATGDPVLDAAAVDRRRGRCVSAFAALCRLREAGTVTLGDASRPGAGSRLDPRLAPEERNAFAAIVRGVAAEADADVDVAADAALDAAGDVEGVRGRHERAARRVAAALTALAKPAAWDMCRAAGCDPEETTRSVSASPFFRMARERRGCDQAPVDDPAAKIYGVGWFVDAVRDGSIQKKEEEREEDEDEDEDDEDDEAEADAVDAAEAFDASAPTPSPTTSWTSRHDIHSDAFDPVFTAGCLALDAWASTADATGRVLAPFSSVEIAYQLVARCLDALTFENVAPRDEGRRISVLEYSDEDDEDVDNDDAAAKRRRRRQNERRRDGLPPRARAEAFARASRAIRSARALSRTYDADAEANARALIPPIELAILVNALMRLAPPRARVSNGSEVWGARDDLGDDDFGDVATLDADSVGSAYHATAGETLVDAMALLRAVAVTSTGSYRDAYVATRQTWSASRTPDGRRIEPYSWIFQSGFARRLHAKLRRRAEHHLYSRVSLDGGWRLNQFTRADALEATADAVFAGMPMDADHATRAMRRARQLNAARLVAVGELTRAEALAFDVRSGTLTTDDVAVPSEFRTRFTSEVMRFVRAWALAGGNPRACDVDLAALDAAYDFRRLAEDGKHHYPPALETQAEHLGHLVETIGWMFQTEADRADEKKNTEEDASAARDDESERSFSRSSSKRSSSERSSSKRSPSSFSPSAVPVGEGARAFAEIAASAAARLAPHAPSDVFARLAVGLGRIARANGAEGWDPTDVSTFALAATKALGPAAFEPQHAKDARDGLEALASAGGFEIPKEAWDALDAADARWRRREAAFIAAQYTFGQGLAAARGIPLDADAVADRDAATAKAAKDLSGKSLAAVAKAWARRARFHGAMPDEDAVAAVVDALPNAEPPATIAELEVMERALLDVRNLELARLAEVADEDGGVWSGVPGMGDAGSHYEAYRDEWLAALPAGKRAKLRAELEVAETTSAESATSALVANARADAAKTRDATRRRLLDALAHLEP